MIISLCSPDKVSLNMSGSFFISMLGRGHSIANIHSFMEIDSINIFIDEYMKRTKNIIFCYYAKKQINKEPDLVIPQKLKEVSNIVLWFNLYSTEPSVRKDEDKNFERLYAEKWKKHLDSLKH